MTALKEIPEAVHRYIVEEEGDALPCACLICGRPQFFIGYIEKSNPNRMLIYSLCGECHDKPESAGLVEKIICYYESARRIPPYLIEHRGSCRLP